MIEVSIYSLLECAERATGSVAVIDVFRAFTTAAVALANGAASIVMVRSVEEALALRDANVGQVCIGEVRGRAPDGFDFGNSPFEISGVDFGGKTIIQRTSAGTQGIVAAIRAERLYAASLVTADATVRALLSDSRRRISLIAMGDNGLQRTDEDELCAIHLRNRSKGGRVIPVPFVASSWQEAKSGAFMNRPVHICTRRMSTSRSTSIATISRLGSISRMVDPWLAWKGQLEAETDEPHLGHPRIDDRMYLSA